MQHDIIDGVKKEKKALQQSLQFNVRYELFILLLSLLSLLNIVIMMLRFIPGPVKDVVFIVDLFLSLVFMCDFFARLFNSKSKKQYFFKDRGWLDFLGSLPFPSIRVLRIFRVVRSIEVIRKNGLKNMLLAAQDDYAQSALFIVFFILIMLLEFGSMSIYFFEYQSPNANIKTAGDALWWNVVTMATVGYGDRFPVTIGGRLVAILVMMVGVGLFGVITGFLANSFLTPRNKKVDPNEVTLESLSKQVADLQKQLNKKNK